MRRRVWTGQHDPGRGQELFDAGLDVTFDIM
jgi:hypothetical protein